MYICITCWINRSVVTLPAFQIRSLSYFKSTKNKDKDVLTKYHIPLKLVFSKVKHLNLKINIQLSLSEAWKHEIATFQGPYMYNNIKGAMLLRHTTDL